MKQQQPEIGSKIKFKGVSVFFWFKDIKEDAYNLLKIDEEYTVATLEANSSWTSVTLKEFPGKKFSLSWFETAKPMKQNKIFTVKLARQEILKHQEACQRIYDDLAKMLEVEDEMAHDYLHDAAYNSPDEESFGHAMSWFETKMKEAKERKLERQLEESSRRIEQALTHIKKPYTKLEIMDMWLSGNFNAELLMHHALLELAKE